MADPKEDEGLSEDEMRVLDDAALASLAPAVEDPSSHAGPGSLKAQAGKAEKAGASAKGALRLSGVAAVLKVMESDEEIRGLGGPEVDVKKIRKAQDFSKILDEMISMAHKYKSGIPPAREAQKDLMFLSECLVEIGSHMSLTQAMVITTAGSLDRYRSMAYIKARRTSVETGQRISENDSKEIAKYLSAPIARKLEAYQVLEKILQHMYFSFKDFKETLNFVVAREWRVMYPNLPPSPPRE